MAKAYSRKYEFGFDRGVYDKIAADISLKKIFGSPENGLLVFGSPEDLILVEKKTNQKKDVVKVHSKKLDEIQSKLESITGINFSQYRRE